MKLPRPARLPRPPRLVLVAAAVAVVLLPALGLGTAYAYTGDIPPGTSALGVDLGGQSRQEAAETLTAALAERSETLAAPVPVRLGSGEDAAETEVLPEEVGLAVDVPATVDAAAGAGGNPVSTVFGAWFGSREVEPVVDLDADRLAELLDPLAEQVGQQMTMPEIRFEGTEPVAVYPEAGIGLDPALAADRLADGWLARTSAVGPTGAGASPEAGAEGAGSGGSWRGPDVVEVPLVEVTPVTTAADVDRLLAEVARPAVAAPVTLELAGGGSEGEGGAAVEIPPEVIAASLRLAADARGEIVPAVDPEALREGLADQLAEVETAPRDARFVADGEELEIEPERAGEQVDTAALAEQLLPVLSAPAPRTVAATVTTVEAELTEADLVELGVTEEVSTFTTYFDGGLSVPRNHNIALLADMVDGALVMPGDVFSLNDFTGPRGYEQGFEDAPVIIDGRLQPAVGGGLSQFTTTLFNASFYAGLEDVEHTPHSYYYSRYPAVIEATIFYPTLDMQFRNNTEQGIVIDTSYDEESITITLWGTKVWDEVTAEWGDRRDVTEPQRRYVDPGPSCLNTEGLVGFTQDAWRVFHRDGEEVEREQFTWRYDAQPEVICAEAPDEAED